LQGPARLEVFFPAAPNISNEVGECKPYAAALEVNRRKVTGLGIQAENIAGPSTVRLTFTDLENRTAIQQQPKRVTHAGWVEVSGLDNVVAGCCPPLVKQPEDLLQPQVGDLGHGFRASRASA